MLSHGSALYLARLSDRVPGALDIAPTTSKRDSTGRMSDYAAVLDEVKSASCRASGLLTSLGLPMRQAELQGYRRLRTRACITCGTERIEIGSQHCMRVLDPSTPPRFPLGQKSKLNPAEFRLSFDFFLALS